MLIVTTHDIKLIMRGFTAFKNGWFLSIQPLTLI
jgi:hypothetical protein